MLPRNRQTFLKNENLALAPFAVRNDGVYIQRRYPEQEHPFRTDFQRDRDRILHSHAFRRLEYKTQVFLSGTGDYLRNRLTHTIEVAAIARTISCALGLNSELTEAIALAHDIGHTPFGHAGERALCTIMKDEGGFDHNLQALRVVDLLEIKYPEYDGINLTLALRQSLFKHRIPGVSKLDGILLPPNPVLEAQAANLADDLTYYGHDVDDGINAGIVKPEMLKSLEIWQKAYEYAQKRSHIPDGPRQVSFVIRCLIDMMVGDAIRYSASRIEQSQIQTPEDAQNLPDQLISFSPDFQRMTDELKKFLFENLYFCEQISILNELSLSRLDFLFHFYRKHPEEMCSSARKRIQPDGLIHAIADHLAGMTDNFAISEYLRLK